MEVSPKQVEYLIKNDPSLWEKYQVLGKIGEGCFGKIYKVKNIRRKEISALKIEYLHYQESERSTLLNEIQIMKKISGVKGVPKIKSSGKWDYGYYLEISLLKSSLYDDKQKQYSISEINTVARELIGILKSIHEHNVIHQDLKPQNIMRDFQGGYAIIDFGLSHIKTGRKQRASGFIGTPRYASIAAHKGIPQQKKDDIESLLYVLAFLYLKRLPWLRTNVPRQKKLEEILYFKEMTSKQVFKKISRGFTIAYEYVKELKDHEEVDYGYLISLFSKQRNTMSPGSFSPIGEIKQSEKSSRRNTDLSRIKNSPPTIVISKVDKTNQNEKTMGQHLGYSEMAQYGYIEIIQVLTQKFLKIEALETPNENESCFYDTQENNEPKLNNLEKYSGQIHFKNPFINPPA